MLPSTSSFLFQLAFLTNSMLSWFSLAALGDLINWSTFNLVKFNPAKSKFFYSASSELADKLPFLPLRVGDEPHLPSTSVKVLRVLFSSDLSMDHQIASISTAANFNLYHLDKIRSCLTPEAAKILVHSLVISHLKYANSLLAELPKKRFMPFQSIQNSASRLIYQGIWSTNESKLRLHWLPIYYRVRFKSFFSSSTACWFTFMYLIIPAFTGRLEALKFRRQEERR